MTSEQMWTKHSLTTPVGLDQIWKSVCFRLGDTERTTQIELTTIGLHSSSSLATWDRQDCVWASSADLLLYLHPWVYDNWNIQGLEGIFLFLLWGVKGPLWFEATTNTSDDQACNIRFWGLTRVLILPALCDCVCVWVCVLWAHKVAKVSIHYKVATKGFAFLAWWFCDIYCCYFCTKSVYCVLEGRGTFVFKVYNLQSVYSFYLLFSIFYFYKVDIPALSLHY